MCRMLKKFVQQGRRRVETGGVPSGYVEDFNEPRTKPEERHVSARRGLAGEKSGFFSILLAREELFGVRRR